MARPNASRDATEAAEACKAAGLSLHEAMAELRRIHELTAAALTQDRVSLPAHLARQITIDTARLISLFGEHALVVLHRETLARTYALMAAYGQRTR
ncbi:hypothetical protein [Bradyrhizobium jicamae]|uniref:hypothetical protein n=1 Tax=Bradyrhizobium jicamae TaxID=280332 RepID=UPI001BA9CB56|nr:hypothetical protein [Bradyrhizobium jicamae]MBR0934860.1 hypothetical protein [Bradyrhizobium jicamae]